MSKVCRCKRGYVSAYDGKCGHCRNRREQEAHSRLVNPELWEARARQARARYAAVARQASIATASDFQDLTKGETL